MTERLKTIKKLIDEGKTSTAIDQLNLFLAQNSQDADMAYYLLGNAFRKQGDWQGALNNYQEAIDINPDSPAAEARNMVIDILNFYNKDMFKIKICLINKKIRFTMAKMKGVVIVNTERCKGCNLCVVACPLHVLSLTSKVNQKGYNYVQQTVEDTCNGCSSCAIVCPDACLTVYRAKEA